MVIYSFNINSCHHRESSQTGIVYLWSKHLLSIRLLVDVYRFIGL